MTTSFPTFLSRHGYFRPEIYCWRHGWELTKYIYSLFFLQASEASTPLVGVDVKHDSKSRVKSKGQASFHTLFPTSRVSQPPTMLRPSPVQPLEISMVVSQPGMMGQVAGSQASVEGVEERLRPETEQAKEVRCSKIWDVNRRCGYVNSPVFISASG